MIFSDSQCPAIRKEKTNFKRIFDNESKAKVHIFVEIEKRPTKRTLIFSKLFMYGITSFV